MPHPKLQKIREWYQQLLQREPLSAELIFWENEIEAGANDENILSDIQKSHEFLYLKNKNNCRYFEEKERSGLDPSIPGMRNGSAA